MDHEDREDIQWIRDAISPARLAPYLAAAGDDLGGAFRLYCWNVEVSAALYGPLHCLEIGLRNALHDQLRRRYGRDDWWEVVTLQGAAPHKLSEAKRKLRENGTASPSADDLVAELTLGFWVSLLSRRSDRHFWVPALHRAFPGYRGRRVDLHRDLHQILLLRNRIMHHEPVHGRRLDRDHATVYRIIAYISPGFAAAARRLDRTPEVLRHRADVCAGLHRVSF